jgi:glycosyltransferase involved in cell wall biosynthesis
MIYVCLPSHDEAETLGLVLWKIRKVFEELGREYHIIVADDGSTDHTADVLDQYGSVVPLTMIRQPEQRGYARTVEALLRRALEMSDRPRRDCAVLMHADYVHRPEALGELVRKLDSGADLVVAEGRLEGEASRGYRWARRFGAFWLRPAVGLPGVRDPLSGFIALRLATVRPVFDTPEPVLGGEGWVASAELLARAAAHARRVEATTFDERHDLRSRPSRVEPWVTARALFGARRSVRHARVSQEPAPPKARRRSRPRGERTARPES